MRHKQLVEMTGPLTNEQHVHDVPKFGCESHFPGIFLCCDSNNRWAWKLSLATMTRFLAFQK
jgi:hypothetical protein